MTSDVLMFECEGSQLLGLLHGANASATTGAIIVVGGPQYRVGSHRQFVHLARSLAYGGVPTLRFDYRGMGDSDGALLGFEHVDEDIAAAVDALCERCPQIENIVLIGLCDAASAALMYAPNDARVKRLIIMNPWVRSAESHARATVKHYYLQRILAPEMWGKILRGQFDWRGSIGSLGRTMGSLIGGSKKTGSNARVPYQQRMLEGAQSFTGKLMLVISGDDMTAAEFLDHVEANRAWSSVLEGPATTIHRMEAANHTFACAAWRDEVGEQVLRWIDAG